MNNARGIQSALLSLRRTPNKLGSFRTNKSRFAPSEGKDHHTNPRISIKKSSIKYIGASDPSIPENHGSSMNLEVRASEILNSMTEVGRKVDEFEESLASLQMQLDETKNKVWIQQQSNIEVDLKLEIKNIIDGEQKYDTVNSVIKDLRKILQKTSKSKFSSQHLINIHPNKKILQNQSEHTDPRDSPIKEDAIEADRVTQKWRTSPRQSPDPNQEIRAIKKDKQYNVATPKSSYSDLGSITNHGFKTFNRNRSYSEKRMSANFPEQIKGSFDKEAISLAGQTENNLKISKIGKSYLSKQESHHYMNASDTNKQVQTRIVKKLLRKRIYAGKNETEETGIIYEVAKDFVKKGIDRFDSQKAVLSKNDDKTMDPLKQSYSLRSESKRQLGSPNHELFTIPGLPCVAERDDDNAKLKFKFSESMSSDGSNCSDNQRPELKVDIDKPKLWIIQASNETINEKEISEHHDLSIEGISPKYAQKPKIKSSFCDDQLLKAHQKFKRIIPKPIDQDKPSKKGTKMILKM